VRRGLRLSAVAVSLAAGVLAAVPDPGPRVGDRFPSFQAVDHEGRARELTSLMGPQGLVLVFFRSADW
jgi:hypothetical protein